MCFYLDVFVLAVIRHLTAATAAATPSILFTGMFVNVLYLSRGGEAPERGDRQFASCQSFVARLKTDQIQVSIRDLTLFLPGEGGISPLIVYHVTTSVRNRVKGGESL